MSLFDDAEPHEEEDDEEEFSPSFNSPLRFDNYGDDPPVPMAVHQCNICNKIFMNFKGLQQHSVIHTDVKPFLCEICGRSFRFKSNMFEHRTVHTGYTPHVCPFCGKSFRLKGNMKKHMRTHVATKEELEAAYRPYSSNRRQSAGVPENAIIIRGCSLPYFQPLKPRIAASAKLQLGKDASKWVGMICRNEMLPSSPIVDKLMRTHVLVDRNHSLQTLFDEAKSIEFEIYTCPTCKCVCGGKLACEVHMMTEHGKKLEDGDKEVFSCEKCMRTFPNLNVLLQHQSYHSRVQLMFRNREIECLPANPEVPYSMICFDLMNNNTVPMKDEEVMRRMMSKTVMENVSMDPMNLQPPSMLSNDFGLAKNLRNPGSYSLTSSAPGSSFSSGSVNMDNNGMMNKLTESSSSTTHLGPIIMDLDSEVI